MKKYYLLIVFCLGFLIAPVKVKSFSPAYYPTETGYYVEITHCDESEDYFIDIIVMKSEVDANMSESGSHDVVPQVLMDSEYANWDNEWVSLSRFFTPGSDQRTECMVNFYKDVESFTEIPYSVYKVVVYENEEMYVSEEYSTWDIPYLDVSGHIVVFDSWYNEFSLTFGPEEGDPITFGGLFAILLLPIIFIGILLYVFLEPLIFILMKRTRRLGWMIILPMNISMVVVIYLITTLSDLYHIESPLLKLIALVVSVIILGLAKMSLLIRKEFREVKLSTASTIMYFVMIVSYGILITFS